MTTRHPEQGRIDTDFSIGNHGSICLLLPHSDAANAWIDDHLPENVMRWSGCVVLEPRYVDDIVCGIENDGLTIS
jgi:hypothetical protein